MKETEDCFLPREHKASGLKDSTTANLAKEWELAHILFKMDCKNCIQASLSNGNASAERVAGVMLCCPSILNGFRQQFKS